MVSPFFPVYIVAFLQHPAGDMGTPFIEIGGHNRIRDMGTPFNGVPISLISLYLCISLIILIIIIL